MHSNYLDEEATTVWTAEVGTTTASDFIEKKTAPTKVA